MSLAWTIARKDLRQRLRDRSAIVLGFVAPLVIAGLMSFAFQGTEHFHFNLLVVDQDHGPVGAALMRGLSAAPIRDVLTVRSSTTDAAAAAVHARHAGAALVIPPNFSREAENGDSVSLRVLTSVDQELDGQVAQSIASSFAAQINADRLSVETALHSGAPAATTGTLVAKAEQLRLPEQVATESIGKHPLTAISYYAPGMAIFFVLFAVGFGSRSFFTERREGTLDRMTAAPISPIAILAGKALSVFVFATLSLATMAVVSSAVFGASWGPTPEAALICIAMALSVVSLTALVITLAHTERQAESMASIFVFGLALLGGNFVFVSAAPPVMRRLALLTPNGWALRGFTDLATSSGAGAAIEPIVAILGITLVLGAVAASLARRTVVQ
ncbi:MAG TPA: ABC transporter permease [Acidimicrobiia bacterium]|nr:ABC transporter permease [Acidimicrobiia bacterium]